MKPRVVMTITSTHTVCFTLWMQSETGQAGHMTQHLYFTRTFLQSSPAVIRPALFRLYITITFP